MDNIMSVDQLCYEVWYETGSFSDRNLQMVSAYWNVMTAWKVAVGISKTHEGTAEVTVANGMEIDVITGVRSKRTDVIKD